MKQEILDKLAAAIASIDTKEAVQALDLACAEAEAIAKAADRTRNRIQEIDLALNAHKRDVGAVADALLDGAEPAMAAAIGPSRESLAEERDTLRQALTQLRTREIAAGEAIETARRQVTVPVAAATAPVMEDLITLAREQARELADTLAAIIALASTTRVGSNHATDAQVALHHLMVEDLLIRYSSTVPVPADFVKALQPIKKVPGIAATVPDRVSPRDDSALTFAAGFAGNLRNARK